MAKKKDIISERFEKVIHPRMPDHLYTFILRTACDWAINNNDIECGEWFLRELLTRNYQTSKAEFESLRRNSTILKQFKGKPCVVCGNPSDSVDHIVPISKGGSNELSNLQPMCRSCNSKKADRR